MIPEALVVEEVENGRGRFDHRPLPMCMRSRGNSSRLGKTKESSLSILARQGNG